MLLALIYAAQLRLRVRALPQRRRGVWIIGTGCAVGLVTVLRQVLPAAALDDLLDVLGALKTNSGKIQEHSASTTRILSDMKKLLKDKSRNLIDTDLDAFVATKTQAALQGLSVEYPACPVLRRERQQHRAGRGLLPFELGQVVHGLVSNAYYALVEKSKATPAFRPELRVSTHLVASQLVVRLRDNDKGITAREVPQLFSPIFTIKPTAKGSGLVLFMAKNIVELHGGTITIDTAEGAFTEVTVALPMRPGSAR